MFKYLHSDSPAHLPASKGYHMGALRAAATYYHDTPLIQELRKVAGNASRDEALHYLHVHRTLRDSAYRALSDHTTGAITLTAAVLNDVTSLLGMLQYMPGWDTVHACILLQGMDISGDTQYLTQYLTELAVLSTHAKLYGNHFARIVSASQRAPASVTAMITM